MEMIRNGSINIMPRTIFFLVFCLIIVFDARAEKDIGLIQSMDHLLKISVIKGGVDYQSLMQNRAQIERMINQIQSFDRNDIKTEEHLKAFYINVYNIITVYSVLKEYPKSVKG